MPVDADLLRRSVILPELIGHHVKLTRHHRHHTGLCPFHAEKTASFYVYDTAYHCFGCGAHGDCFSWVMAIDGVGFLEAARRLGGNEIDAGELRRRERARQQEAAAAAKRWRDDNPWRDVERQWEAERATLERHEVAWMHRFRTSADFDYLRAEWERSL